MRRLRQLQLAFSESVLGASVPVLEELAAPPAGDLALHFGIYKDGYRLRLIGSLATDYPATKAMLGEDRFGELARAFVERHPSPYFNLRWYGAEFADFIGERTDHDHALTGAMAAFEWAITGAFDAPDAAPVTVEQLTRIPLDAWPELRFELHPSLRRLDVPTAVPQIWKAATAHEPLPTPARSPTSAWIVWRKDLAVLYRPAADDEVAALDAVAAGASFAEVCAGLAARLPEAETAVRAAVLLRQWVQEGLIAALHAAS